MYAEVILPLPVGATFSYRIPDDLLGLIVPGLRVIVPFGRKKYYTGIVVAVTPRANENFDIKDISLVVDDKPVLKHPQIKLWQWVADYYLCPLGDVYRAAVPAGLKIESETFVELNPDYDRAECESLSATDSAVIALLDHSKGAMRVSGIKRDAPADVSDRNINSLLDRGILIISEKLVERYRPRYESYVRHTVNTPVRRQEAFAAVKGAPRQEKLLMTLLMLSQTAADITVPALLERSGCSRAILNALVDKDIAYIEKRCINRFAAAGTLRSELPVLTEAQSAALNSIHKSWLTNTVTLLHGVTSSGKTEVYMHLIDDVLSRGRQVLYLVPEIALTTQLTRRLQQVFGDRVIIYHSKFSDNERVDIWRKLLDSPGPCVVVGVRSSVFLPFDSLGLVIVDEEHDQSYKQGEPSPRYNGRDVAVVLAGMHGAKVLLGSATPSIETYYKASNGKFGLVTLAERYGDAMLPEVSIIDLNRARRAGQLNGTFATETVDAVRDSIEAGRQAIIFKNRRGYAPMARCTQCAYIPKCDNCDVSLTYHKRLDRLVCHYCGSTYPMPHVCPQCKEPGIEIVGYGTERIEDEIVKLFPKARVARMDLDTTRNKGAYADIIDNFSAHKSDILVGTQMVSKGLDFSDVDCVAVMSADGVISQPDFRSGERTFNMLEQVAGRAGRAPSDSDRAARVLVQTGNPSHPVIRHLLSHDYAAHYADELEGRRAYNYPPFSRIIYIYLKHKDVHKLNDLAREYADELRKRLGNRVFGPEEPAVGRVNMLYIRKIMLKIETTASITRVRQVLHEVFTHIAATNANLRPGTLHYDVDPM